MPPRPLPVVVMDRVVGTVAVWWRKEAELKAGWQLLLWGATCTVGLLAGGWILARAPALSAPTCPGLLLLTGCALGGVAAASAAKKPALLMLGDGQMFEELLVDTLARELGVRVTDRAGATTAAQALAAQPRPDLVLLDIERPGGDGLDLIAPLRRKLPRVKILILSSHFDPYTVYRVLQGGVQGYVEKRSPLSVLLEAVRRVLKGQSYFSSTFVAVQTQYLDAAEAFHKILSEREQQVLRFMSEGLCDADIARHCAITELTVSTHRKHIRTKLDAHSDRELLAYARRWGLGPREPADPPLARVWIPYKW